MFRKTPEQQIVAEADKIASMKESLDALSWSRVADISKTLQENPSEKERYELARELTSIAQANTSLIHKLGFTNTTFTGQLMASGIESLGDASNQTSSSSYSLLDKPEPPILQTLTLQETTPHEPALQEPTPQEPASQDPAFQELPVADLPKKSSSKDISEMVSLLMKEDAFDISEIDDVDLALIDTVLQEITTENVESLSQGEDHVSLGAVQEKEEEISRQPEPVPAKKSKEYILLPDPVNENTQPFTVQKLDVLPPEEEKKEFRSLEVVLENPGASSRTGGRKPRWFKRQDLARFKRIYASRDDALYIYEDSMGHIVAIDSSKLI